MGRGIVAAALALVALSATVGAGGCFAAPPEKPSSSIDPKNLPRVGTIDERFQSYNIEMVEVTGGRFWKPYDSRSQPQSDLFEYRPPIDLANPTLRRLASELAPAYLRVSGTWANATYFADRDSISRPPPG